MVTAVAGKGVGYSEMEDLAADLQAGWITSLALDRAGNLYFVDHYNNQINRMDAAGWLSNVAGRRRFGGDGEAASHAVMSEGP